jgi:hypothetical protein
MTNKRTELVKTIHKELQNTIEKWQWIDETIQYGDYLNKLEKSLQKNPNEQQAREIKVAFENAARHLETNAAWDKTNVYYKIKDYLQKFPYTTE